MPRPNWGWQDDAACRGKEVVLFFGPDGERQPERDIRERKAKVVCASCPVRAECLGYAVSRPEKYGTWGGLNEDERASERRRRMRRANAARASRGSKQHDHVSVLQLAERLIPLPHGAESGGRGQDDDEVGLGHHGRR